METDPSASADYIVDTDPAYLSLPPKVIGSETLATVVEYIGRKRMTKEQLGVECIRFLHHEAFIRTNALAKITVPAFLHIAQNNYQPESPVRFDRVVRRLTEIITSLTSDEPQPKHAANVFDAMKLYFRVPDNKQFILSQALLNEKFAELVELADGRVANVCAMRDAIVDLAVYLEGAHELQIDVQNDEFEQMLDHLWFCARAINDDTKRSYVWKRISSLARMSGYGVTKESLRQEVYIPTIRIVPDRIGYKISYRLRSFAPFLDRYSIRFKRFNRRTDRYNDATVTPCHRTMDMHWALRCYFEPMVGPKLNIETLRAKIDRLLNLTYAGAWPYSMEQRLTDIAKYARELNDFLESVETVTGIDACKFDDLVEKSGILREITQHRRYALWEPIVLRVNSMKDLVRMEDHPEDDNYPPYNEPPYRMYTLMSDEDDYQIVTICDLHRQLNAMIKSGKVVPKTLLHFVNQRYYKPKDKHYTRLVKRVRVLLNYAHVVDDKDILDSYLVDAIMNYGSRSSAGIVPYQALFWKVDQLRAICIDRNKGTSDMLALIDRFIEWVERIDRLRNAPYDCNLETIVDELHCIRSSLRLELPKTVIWRQLEMILYRRE